jgi:hypothetical protein
MKSDGFRRLHFNAHYCCPIVTKLRIRCQISVNPYIAFLENAFSRSRLVGVRTGRPSKADRRLFATFRCQRAETLKQSYRSRFDTRHILMRRSNWSGVDLKCPLAVPAPNQATKSPSPRTRPHLVLKHETNRPNTAFIGGTRSKE